MKNTVSHIDVVAARWVGHIPKPWYRFFVVLGAVVRPLFWIIIGLLSSAFFFLLGSASSGFILLITTAFIPLSAGLKFLFRRTRPVTIYTENMRIKSYSFPSSHSYAAAVGTTIVVYVCAVFAPYALPFVIPSVLIVATMVGISRIYVGAHYPSDVIGGLALGWIVVGAIMGVITV